MNLHKVVYLLGMAAAEVWGAAKTLFTMAAVAVTGGLTARSVFPDLDLGKQGSSLEQLFPDAAGLTDVHIVGAFIALAIVAIIDALTRGLLEPRLSAYRIRQATSQSRAATPEEGTR